MISASVGVEGSLAGTTSSTANVQSAPAVAVELGDVGANRRIAAGLLLGLQDWVVVALEEVEASRPGGPT